MTFPRTALLFPVTLLAVQLWKEGGRKKRERERELDPKAEHRARLARSFTSHLLLPRPNPLDVTRHHSDAAAALFGATFAAATSSPVDGLVLYIYLATLLRAFSQAGGTHVHADGDRAPRGPLNPWPALLSLPLLPLTLFAPLLAHLLLQPVLTWKVRRGFAELMEVREEWWRRCRSLKIEPPRIRAVEHLPPATVLRMTAPATVGAAGFRSSTVVNLLLRTFPPGTALIPLPEPGDPSASTTHPTDLTVLVMPVPPPPVDEHNLGLMIRATVQQAITQLGSTATPHLVSVEERGDRLWETSWVWADGIGSWAGLWEMAGSKGCADGLGLFEHVQVDRKAGTVFYGLPSWSASEEVVSHLEDLAADEQWRKVWSLLPNGSNPPSYQPKLSHTLTYDGEELHVDVFSVRQGMSWEDWCKEEGKLKTALGGAHLLALLPFLVNGSRHPTAFQLVWAKRGMPARVSDVLPERGAEAAVLIVSALVSHAFDGARVARPDVVAARCLNRGRAEELGALWRVKVRLRQGTSISSLQSRLAALKSGLGVEHLRLVPSDKENELVIYAGARYQQVSSQLDPTERGELDRVEWEAAWREAGVVGALSRTPSFLSTRSMPRNPKVKETTFALPAGLDIPSAREGLGKVANQMGFAWTAIQPGGKPGTITVRHSSEDPIPDIVPFAWDELDERRGIPFGSDPTGEVVRYDPASSPHLLVVGATGSGKSVALQAIIACSLIYRWDVHVIDPVKGGADFAFAKPFCRSFEIELERAAAAMERVYAEVTRRKTLNSQHGVGSSADLPEHLVPRRLLLVIDEFTSLVTLTKVPPKSEDEALMAYREEVVAENSLRASIARMVGKIAREARSALVTLLLATQRLTARTLDDLPGTQDLKTNLARLGLGRMSQPEKMSAFRLPSEVPDLGRVVPKGRGVYEPSDSAPTVVQCWYASQQELRGKVEAALKPSTRPSTVPPRPR